MKIESERLFGIPYAICYIDSKSYDKRRIVRDIRSNYLKNPVRNKWEDESNIHHAYNDWDNSEYNTPHYESLVKVYEKIIPDCLDTFKFGNGYSWDFQIVNYNCMSGGGFMNPHNHPSHDFVGIHYIQFDPRVHIQTEYTNEHPFASYQNHLRPDLREIMGSSNHPHHSFWGKYWRFPVEENMFCMTPGFLYHRVPAQPKSNKLRMAIIVNINIKKCQN